MENESDILKLKRQERIRHNQLKKDSRRILSVEPTKSSCLDLIGIDEKGHKWKISLFGCRYEIGTADNQSVLMSSRRGTKNWIIYATYVGGYLSQHGIRECCKENPLSRTFSVYGLKKMCNKKRNDFWFDWGNTVPPKYRMFRHKERYRGMCGEYEE